MELIIGGAYQGKLDYARLKYPEAPVIQCDENTPELDLPEGACIINAFHLFLLARIHAGLDPLELQDSLLAALDNKIIVCDDISCGIVPLSHETRLWREAAGRCLVRISMRADTVTRVFCGIASALK